MNLLAAELEVFLLMDEKIQSNRDIEIWNERTGGYFDTIEPSSIYEFGSAALLAYFVTDHNSTASVTLVGKLGLDLLVNAGTPRRLRREIIDSAQYGFFERASG